MKVSIYTLILPRQETFFLEEWIEHHFRLGIDEIYIYENGMIPSNKAYNGKWQEWSPLNLELNQKVWTKKPLTDFFMDYTDKQIYEELHSVVRKYSNVHLLQWHIPYDAKGKSNYAQLEGLKHCIKHHSSDWWIPIDVDEYINPLTHKGIKEFISDKNNSSYSAFWIQQRVFDKRVRGKKVREIVNWGYDLELTKVIIREEIEKFDIHFASPRNGKIKKVSRDEMIFHHYRGSPKYQGGNHHRKKEYLNCSFEKIDSSIARFMV